MEKARVLLINPPITSDFEIFEENAPSLGLMYIAAVLERKGFPVRIVDCLLEWERPARKAEAGKGKLKVNGLSDEEILQKVREFRPDIVGISTMFTAFLPDVLRVANAVRKEFPEIIICSGGAHVSVMPESVLKPGAVDIAVIGEGELTFLEIAEKVSAKKSWKSIQGTAVLAGGKVKVNARREYLKDLDSLPFPARHLIPLEKHLKSKSNYPFAKKKPVLEIITSRGCPGKCVFCSIHAVWGHTWRYRSPLNVVDEMEMLVKKYGVREFSILDDNVSANPERLVKMCDEIIRRRLDIAWETPNGIALWTLNEKILRLMKKSGYYRAKFGIESGCIPTLRYIGKPINLEKAREVINACNRVGIWASSSFVIGFPDEDLKSINETIDFVNNSGLDFARFLIAQPFPHTPLFNDFKRLGLLKKGLINGSSAYSSKYDTLHFKASELNEIRQNAESQFIRRKMREYLSPKGFPKFLLPKISSPKDFAYFMKMAFRLLKTKASGEFL